MKFVVLVLLALVACGLSTGFLSGVKRLKRFRGHGVAFRDSAVPNNMSRWFSEAVVDNFAPVADVVLWRQQYFVNDTFWGGPGYPVFFMLGGEGPLSDRYFNGYMFMNELARQHKGLILGLEHRFYGLSWPTADMSTANLAFLSAEQALADAARFRTSDVVMQMVGPNSKWIVLGGSYSGALAGWFRLKYPHLVTGSIASSAPVQPEVDFKEYNEVVGASLRYFGGDACYNAVAAASAKLYALMQSPAGLAQALADFAACGNVTSMLDRGVFEGGVSGTIQGIAQYNNDHPDRPIGPTLTDVCGNITAAADPYTGLVAFTKLVQAGQCMDVSYAEQIAELQNVTFDGLRADRQWLWQTCNEYGYYQTSTSPNEPFAALADMTLDSNLAMCRDAFDSQPLPDVGRCLADFGGLRLAGTRILLPNGSIDPWHALGITDQTPVADPSEIPVYIQGTAHCADVYAPAAQDVPALTAARLKIAGVVNAWLTSS